MKRYKIPGFLILILFGFIIISNSCSKNDNTPASPLPVLTTASVSNINGSTAECGGNIIFEGSSAVTARGVCWSTDSTPAINHNKTNDGAGGGKFISTITGLTPNVPGEEIKYFVRAYATNSSGTAYGNTVSFKIGLPDPPPPPVPIEGGLIYLLIAGLVYGVHKFQKNRKY
jgi:hypothetical protein